MVIKIGDVFYNDKDYKVEVINTSGNEIGCVVYKEITITYNAGRDKETNIQKVEEQYLMDDIGIRLFYKKGDVELYNNRTILNDSNYLWNEKNIKENYDKIDDYLRNQIIKDAPNNAIFTSEQRTQLIRAYLNSDQDLQIKEEKSFFEKYGGKYHGRMDFDIEYYYKSRPDLWKEHYYNKVYVGKKAVFDEDNNLVIVDWRSPIGSFFVDEERRMYDPEIHDNYVHNYELLLKRRFNDFGEWRNTFIADSEIFKDGNIDRFLIDILIGLRQDDNDKAADIISTIQADQNRIVREKLETSFYVQGCAGSGKTMILLHRLSYLLYNHKGLDTSKIKIITPNENISNQLKDLSAELEVSNIEQLTLEKYYLYLISKYSDSFYELLIKNLHLKNEEQLSEKFLDSIYDDECYNLFLNNYNSFFDNIYKKTQNFIPLNDFGNDVKSLQGYSKQLFNFQKEFQTAFSQKESLQKTIDKNNQEIKNIREQYNKEIKSNKRLLSLNKEIETLKKDKEFFESFVDDSKRIQDAQLKFEANKKSLEVFNKYLKLYKNLRQSEIIEDASFTSINDIIAMENQYQQAEQKLLTDIKSIKNELIDAEKVKQELFDEILSKCEENNKLSKLHFIKHLKLSKQIRRLNEDFEEIFDNVESISKGLAKKEKAYDILLLNNNNSRSYAKNFLNQNIELLNNEQKILRNEIESNETQLNKLLKKYQLTLENVGEKTIEINNRIKYLDGLIFNENESLLVLKNDINELELKNNELLQQLENIFPYTKEQEKDLIKHFNYILAKVNQNDYESRLKLTDYQIINSILKSFYEDLASRFPNDNFSDDYRFKLFYMLSCLIKMYGSKNIDFMLNIDEAQDISLNEYHVLKQANKEAVFNLYGDTNQLLAKNRGISKWASLIDFELKPFKLNINYRNTYPITTYVNKQFASLNMEPMGIPGNDVSIISHDNLNNYLNNKTYLIVKDKKILSQLNINLKYNFIEKKEDVIDKNVLNILTVQMAKGMEFHDVVVVEESMSVREKYVAYTRALNNLTIVK